MPTRKYTYYDFTLSLCPECLRRVDAKIVFENENVYMLKRCNEHGNSKVLIADDIEYYKNIRNYNKPSETPYTFNTKTHYGCPYDCGLCPDHEQHSCLTVVEVTDRCNLTCPTCYAGSSPTYGRHRTLDEVKTMLDTIVKNEKEPDVVQISGGEPTIHPQFWEILDYAKSLPIRHLMLNTNGIKIAKDFAFAERLKTYTPDFEIYLQFDSFKNTVLQELQVSPEVAELALKEAASYGAVSKATCSQSTSTILSRLPGFESINASFFPKKTMAAFAKFPGVKTRKVYDDDPDDNSAKLPGGT